MVLDYKIYSVKSVREDNSVISVLANGSADVLVLDIASKLIYMYAAEIANGKGAAIGRFYFEPDPLSGGETSSFVLNFTEVEPGVNHYNGIIEDIYSDPSLFIPTPDEEDIWKAVVFGLGGFIETAFFERYLIACYRVDKNKDAYTIEYFKDLGHVSIINTQSNEAVLTLWVKWGFIVLNSSGVILGRWSQRDQDTRVRLALNFATAVKTSYPMTALSLDEKFYTEDCVFNVPIESVTKNSQNLPSSNIQILSAAYLLEKFIAKPAFARYINARAKYLTLVRKKNITTNEIRDLTYLQYIKGVNMPTETTATSNEKTNVTDNVDPKTKTEVNTTEPAPVSITPIKKKSWMPVEKPSKPGMTDDGCIIEVLGLYTHLLITRTGQICLVEHFKDELHRLVLGSISPVAKPTSETAPIDLFEDPYASVIIDLTKMSILEEKFELIFPRAVSIEQICGHVFDFIYNTDEIHDKLVHLCKLFIRIAAINIQLRDINLTIDNTGIKGFLSPVAYATLGDGGKKLVIKAWNHAILE